MPEYREIAPSAAFAGAIECFWTLHLDGHAPAHRVTPDGCADILLSAAKLTAVGAMTRYQDFAHEPGERVTAIRFRPGAWASYFGIPGSRVTDQVVPLEDLWGSARARLLQDRLSSAHSLEDCAMILETSLPAPRQTTPVERAIRWMEQRHGAVSMDRLADRCGLSPRQFRRLCLEQSGLSPKFLARVLRFRYAVSRIPYAKSSAANLALDCGYYDQAHFINECRALSGRTPAAFEE